MPATERSSTIGAVSLVLGPALMSAGDLVHPAERWMPADQVAILSHSASHWYVAHLLLFIGILVFVPGILELTRLVSSRRASAGYAARLLLVVSVGALSALFVFEMLLGQFALRADQPSAVALLEAFQSLRIFGAVIPGLLAFFVGTGIAVVTLASPASPYRWPSIVLGLGAIFILGEIILAQVLLSQIGNVLILASGVGFARVLLREPSGRRTA